jgi:hypothetical protein
MAKELHHMCHACPITVKCNGFFVFANFLEILAKIFVKMKIFAKRNFAKIVPFSHDFRIFAKIERCIFSPHHPVSTLQGAKTVKWGEGAQQGV